MQVIKEIQDGIVITRTDSGTNSATYCENLRKRIKTLGASISSSGK